VAIHVLANVQVTTFSVHFLACNLSNSIPCTYLSSFIWTIYRLLSQFLIPLFDIATTDEQDRLMIIRDMMKNFGKWGSTRCVRVLPLTFLFLSYDIALLSSSSADLGLSYGGAECPWFLRIFVVDYLNIRIRVRARATRQCAIITMKSKDSRRTEQISCCSHFAIKISATRYNSLLNHNEELRHHMVCTIIDASE
jgi:hypothetical protein